MKIKFLGTGTDTQIPGVTTDDAGNLTYCQCKNCQGALKDPSKRRRHSSIYIEEYNMVVDMPPEINFMVRDYLVDKNRKIDNVFFTHAHTDHRSGYQDLFYYYVYKGSKGLTTNFYTSKWVSRRLKDQGDYLFNPRKGGRKTLPPLINLVEFGNRNVYNQIKIGELTVLPLRVDHEKGSLDTDTDTVGLLFEEKKKGFFYAPDFYDIPERSFKRLLKERKGLDKFIFIPGTFPGKTYHGHAGTEKILELSEDLDATDIYFTHVSHGVDAEKVKEKHPHVKFAEDGLEIEI